MRHDRIQGLTVIVHARRDRSLQQRQSIWMFLPDNQSAVTEIGANGATRQVYAAGAICPVTGCA
jgi:hypothetical protein